MARLMTTFYEQIKKFRINAGMTQADFARKLQLTRASVNSWETGLSLPSLQSVVDIAELFNVTTDTILGVNHKYILDISDLDDAQKKALTELVQLFKESNFKTSAQSHDA